MGLFNRGQSISGMWLDGKPAIRAYLGDVLVWDGTKPAFVNVPRALASALAVAPAVRADASITSVRAMGSSSVIAPSLTAFATVDPETAVIVTAQASAPVVRADSIIMVETITVGAQALPAVAAQSSAATVAAPAAVVSVVTPTPSVAAHFATTVPAIAVNVSAQVPVITATGAAVVNVPVAAVNATARIPVVSGNSSVVAFAVTADAAAKTPVVTASSNVSPPKAAATGLAPVPVVQGINFTPTGMTKNGNQSVTSATAIKVTGWTADSGSTVSGNGLVPGGSKTATATFGLSVANAGGSQTMYMALYKNGVQVGATASKAIAGFASDTITSSLSVAVIPSDLIEMYTWTQFSATVTVNGGSGTYVRLA